MADQTSVRSLASPQLVDDSRHRASSALSGGVQPHRRRDERDLVPLVARGLAIATQERPLLPWRVSMRLERKPDGAFDFEVSAGSTADGLAIDDLSERQDAWVTMIVRDRAFL